MHWTTNQLVDALIHQSLDIVIWWDTVELLVQPVLQYAWQTVPQGNVCLHVGEIWPTILRSRSAEPPWFPAVSSAVELLVQGVGLSQVVDLALPSHCRAQCFPPAESPAPVRASPLLVQVQVDLVHGTSSTCCGRGVECGW